MAIASYPILLSGILSPLCIFLPPVYQFLPRLRFPQRTGPRSGRGREEAAVEAQVGPAPDVRSP